MKNKILSAIILFELMMTPLFVAAPILDKPYSPRVIEYNSEAPREWAIETGLIKENDFTDRSVHCESSWRYWICNQDYGCIAGMGLAGIVSGTWNKTIVEMSKNDIYMPNRCWELIYLPVGQEKNEPIFDGECNLRVAIYIYQTKGTAPWGTADSDWGSHGCWSYANNI